MAVRRRLLAAPRTSLSEDAQKNRSTELRPASVVWLGCFFLVFPIFLMACGRIGFDGVATDGAVEGDGGGPSDGGAVDSSGDAMLPNDGAFYFDDDERISRTATTFEGHCEGDGQVTIDFDGDTQQVACTDERFAFVASAERDGTYEITGRQGVWTDVTRWIRDTVPPTISDIDLGPNPTRTRIMPVRFHAEDDVRVGAFCVDWQGESIEEGHPCFIRVDSPSVGAVAGPSVDVGPVDTPLGFTSGTYDVRIAVRDEAGNVAVSPVQAIAYNGSDPPVVGSVVVAAQPMGPLSSAEINFPAEAKMYVHAFVHDEEPFGDDAFVLHATSDERTFTPLAVEHTCEPRREGHRCWAVTSPSSSYFRVRVQATDRTGQISSAMSGALNTRVRYLVGSTHVGLDGSGHDTALRPPDPSPDTVTMSTGGMVVMDDGTLFLRDDGHGVLEIAPDTGRVTVLLEETGTSSGDGGPVASATATDVIRIATGGNGELVVWDRDRIRHIDLTVAARTIRTVIGGGSSTDDEAAPTAVRIDPGNIASRGRRTLAVSSNGDIFFSSESDPEERARIRHFDVSAGVVRSIRLTGAWREGYTYDACHVGNHAFYFDAAGEIEEALALVWTDDDNPSCLPPDGASGYADLVRFDVATGRVLATVDPSAVTSSYWDMRYCYPAMGGDGSIHFTHAGRVLSRYRDGRLELVGGLNDYGYCLDGTRPRDCRLRTADQTVARDGTHFLWDNGVIRYVDPDGRLKTLYGRGFGAHPSNDASDFRFSSVGHLQSEGSGRITLLDPVASYLMEWVPGEDVLILAGNGSSGEPAMGLDATAQPLFTQSAGNEWSNFERMGDAIYFNANFGIARLNGGVWQLVAGGGGTPYYDAMNTAGLDVTFQAGAFWSYPPSILAQNGNGLLLHISSYNNTLRRGQHARFMFLTVPGHALVPIAGTENTAEDFCAPGTAATSCDLPIVHRVRASAWYDRRDAWVMTHRLSPTLLATDGTTVNELVRFPELVRTMAFDEANERIYACTQSRRLWMSVAGGTPSELDLGSPTMRCGDAMHASNGVLTFVVQQNGLETVAQYLFASE